ncbi:MAG: RdgB/HAM1 family non-canonical purine NTP pyrophosphatase [Chitinophagales bacterium]
MTFVFATNNKNKIKEVMQVLPSHITILSLQQIGCFEELPETHATIEENSMEKAVYVYQKYGYDCFAEDSGLEVAGLKGDPGVHSAYYSGSRDPEANIRLLLHNLRGIKNRVAQFKTVFSLVSSRNTDQFLGIVTGKILEEPRGSQGFGYDPVFVPDGSVLTFAEMNPVEKVAKSHRTKAFQSMTRYVEKHF